MTFKISNNSFCDFIWGLRLAPQYKCLITIVSMMFFVVWTALLALMIFLISLTCYKDITNSFDNHEFNELSYIEMNIENSQMLLEETYKDHVLLMGRMFENYARVNIYHAFVVSDNKNTSLSPDNIETIYTKKLKLLTPILNSQFLFSTKTKQINATFIGCYFISEKQCCKIIEETNEETQTITKLTSDETDKLLEYLKTQTIKAVGKTGRLHSVLPKSIEAFDSYYTLPVFDESQTFPFDNNKIVSYCILPVESKGPIYSENYLSGEDFYAFFMLEKKDTNELIYDSIIESIPSVNILKTDYLYPYRLHSKEYCILLRMITSTTQDETEIEEYDYDKFEYLDQCFDNTNLIEKYSGTGYEDHTFLYDFLYNFHLFSRPLIENTTKDETVKALLQATEEHILMQNETLFNQTINLLISINNSDFKVKKAYSPLYAFYQVDYFYPFSDYSMNLLIKSQSFRTFISNEVRDIMSLNLINCLIYIFFVMILSFIALRCTLSQFTKQIEKAINIFKFLKGFSTDSTQSNQKLTNEDGESGIDEFRDLIHTFNEMIKGDIDLKQGFIEKEAIKYKLDMEQFNREFEHVKIHNIIVKEEEIEEFLEEGNCTTEITRISLDEIKKDPFVKKSAVFKSMVNYIEKNKK